MIQWQVGGTIACTHTHTHTIASLDTPRLFRFNNSLLFAHTYDSKNKDHALYLSTSLTHSLTHSLAHSLTHSLTRWR